MLLTACPDSHQTIDTAAAVAFSWVDIELAAALASLDQRLGTAGCRTVIRIRHCIAGTAVTGNSKASRLAVVGCVVASK